jgi:hypothetical protein
MFVKPNILQTLALIVGALSTSAMADPAPESAPSAPTPPAASAAPLSPLAAAASALKLPGVVINMEQHCVDIDSTICLESGSLELVASTKEGKVHESVIAVEARPVHIHTALLLLGAKNGSPAMRQPIDNEQVRWVDIPPHGDPIGVFLVWKDAEGKMIERPIGDFISFINEEGPEAGQEKKAAESKKFPSSFLFAGSFLGDKSKKPRDYLADLSGNVISIATYGDEVLCLPSIESQDNGSLVWEVNSKTIPKLGTKVTLRLRPQKPSPKTPEKSIK